MLAGCTLTASSKPSVSVRMWALARRCLAASVARTGMWELQIVRRCDQHRFVVLPKRWIVERTLAWISRCRRLARDYERHARKAAVFVRLAMIRLMLRRLGPSR